MPQCCPQQLDPNHAPNPTISTHLVVPPLWLSLCQTLCSLQCQLWRLNPDPAPKNVTLSINLVSLLPTLWMALPVTLWMMSVMIFSLFLMYMALFWRSQILSRFMTPDRVTNHVTGQVTFHRPFPCLSMFVDVCLHMFGHLTFLGNCI